MNPYRERQIWVNDAIGAAFIAAERYQRSGMAVAAKHAYQFAIDLAACEKFFLPDRDFDQVKNGGMLSRATPFELFSDLIRCPYSVFSVVFGLHGDVPSDEECPGMKRVLLVREEDGIIGVECAAFAEPYNRWVLLPGRAEFPAQAAGIFKTNTYGRREMLIRFNSLGFQMTPDVFLDAGHTAIGDAFDVVEALIVLGTENAIRKKVTANQARNEKRERKGKDGFCDYWILDVPTSASSDSRFGTHAPPRFHMRRGHLRRLQSGKTTWVRPHTVGNSENGIVTKDYALRVS